MSSGEQSGDKEQDAADGTGHAPDEQSGALGGGSPEQAGVDGIEIQQKGTEAAPVEVPRDGGAVLEKPILSPLLVPSPEILKDHPADDLHAPDSPTTSLIFALRLSLQQLTEQSHQLNAKLVTSISRVADLEGNIDDLKDEQVQHVRTVQELEKDKAQWEESMKTGLLVERDQIRDEMQRLAAGLVEEERRRGSAELGREKLEGEVDTLTASLFDQANTMVATERHGRVQAETRLTLAEENLSVAEAAVRDMQVHLQTLSAAAPPTSTTEQSLVQQQRLLNSHVPYTEFIAFIKHIRMARPQKQSSLSFLPPVPVPSLLSLPFLARAVTEDHEPCIRLDAAPDLSWLSRRSVGAAIIAGELMIEPVSASSILSSNSSPSHELTCSLCAKYIFPNANAASSSPLLPSAPSAHPLTKTGTSSSRFSLKPFFNSSTSAPASPAPPSSSSTQIQPSLGSIYIFRIAPPVTATQANTAEAKSYPLCRSGWCLERLRATCAFWHFVRSGMVQVIWKGEDGDPPSMGSPVPTQEPRPEHPPTLPPRKKSWGLGGFKAVPNATPASGSNAIAGAGWGLGFKGVGMSPPVSPKAARQGGARTLLKDHNAGDAEGEVARVLKMASTSGVGVEDEEGVREVEHVAHNEDTPVATEPEAIEEARETETGSTETGVPVVVEAALDKPETEDQPVAAPIQEDKLNASAPSSSASSLHWSDGEEASFSTPKGINAELSPSTETADELATAPIEIFEVATSSGDASAAGNVPPSASAEVDDSEVDEVSTAAEPVAEVSAASEQTQEGVIAPHLATSDGPTPPPVPRRAAARPRPASRLLDGSASGTATPAYEGSRTPALQEEPEVVTPVTATLLSDADEALEQSVAEINPPSLPPRAAAAPPPIPSRTPRASMDLAAPPLPTRAKDRPVSLIPLSGKTYSEGEEWEVKTWREIVKLKEAMWKARVGVEDVDE